MSTITSDNPCTLFPTVPDLAFYLTNDDSKIKQLRDYLVGNWEMCWNVYNRGHDYALKPMPYEHPLNNLVYPYAVDDNVQDNCSPKEFA